MGGGGDGHSKIALIWKKWTLSVAPEKLRFFVLQLAKILCSGSVERNLKCNAQLHLVREALLNAARSLLLFHYPLSKFGALHFAYQNCSGKWLNSGTADFQPPKKLHSPSSGV